MTHDVHNQTFVREREKLFVLLDSVTEVCVLFVLLIKLYFSNSMRDKQCVYGLMQKDNRLD